ncbi:hypothetical protein MML48_10g00007977 [Holotrichia oblita]|uniref:Uncharacterized protein n=1 Tax=Holotrichia oblita TaxID=644536 RepID=A0ACB9SLE9_HOLOL|nr:hypothetical protein MML48_10g00007977 [Holotrichia oblita]
MERRSSLSRTPPYGKYASRSFSAGTPDTERGNAVSEENMCDSPWQDEDVETSPIYKLNDVSESYTVVDNPIIKKRKGDSPNKGTKGDGHFREMAEVLTFMDKLYNKTDSLRKVVQESTKTKTEIKTITRELVHIVGLLRKKVDALQTSHINLTAKSKEQATLLEEKEKMTQTAGTREYNIRETLSTKSDFGSLARIMDTTWPGTVYRVTEVKNTSLHEISPEDDLVVLMDPYTKQGDKGLTTLVNRYPAIGTFVDEGLMEGQIEFIKTNTEITSSRNKNIPTKNRNSVFILPVKIREGGFADMEIISKMCGELKHEHNSFNKLVVVALDKQFNLGYLRKCFEFIFHTSDYKISLANLTNTVSRVPSTPGARVKQQQSEIGKVIVKAQGKSYADLLKTVKTSVNLEEIGVSIRKVKRTQKGDLLLEVPGRENANKLSQAVKTSSSEAEVILKMSDTVVHINNIDADISAEDLKEEIRKHKKDLRDDQIKVLSMRPMMSGSQAASVLLCRGLADYLVNMRNKNRMDFMYGAETCTHIKVL